MTSKRAELTLVGLITFTALVIRLFPVLTRSFPLNDGGLFHSMIVDLQANNFSLPEFTSYNNSELPYAYPPLAFYIAGTLSWMLGVKPLDLLRILPPLISSFTIPLFFLLSTRVAQSRLQRIFAVLLFAFTPMAFEWQVMGGGLTRSLGQVFAIATMIFAIDTYKDKRRADSLALMLAGALTVLTHPEAAMQTAIGVSIIAIVVGKNRNIIPVTLVMGLGVLLLSSPWWGVLLARHGASPFLAAAQAARQDGAPFLVRLVLPFRFNITEEPFISFTAVLGAIGVFLAFSRRDFLLPVWMLCALLIDPRGGTRFSMIPLCLLGGASLSMVWAWFGEVNIENIEEALLGTRPKRLLFGYLFITLLLGAFVTMQNIQQGQSLTADEQKASAWIKQNTPSQATFIAITGARPLLDPFTEWLPALTDRRLLTSAFGHEWLNDGKFGLYTQAYRNLQECAYRESACIDRWMKANQKADYLIISPESNQPNRFPLQVWLADSTNFSLIYKNETVSVYVIN